MKRRNKAAQVKHVGAASGWTRKDKVVTLPNKVEVFESVNQAKHFMRTGDVK